MNDEQKQMKVYLDNAATSYPKPPGVIRAIVHYLEQCGASPGRSGHSMSLRAAREVFAAREKVADLFHLGTSERVVFTHNATHALNIAIKGVLKEGDHVIISSMEHNSVHRPVRYLEKGGIIEVSVASCDQEGHVDCHHLKTLFRPNTRMTIINHGSNVTGVVQPIREIGRICRDHNVPLLVDAAQTAGFIPIDMQQDMIDILAFTGHKELYGPPGTGGLCISRNIDIDPLYQGGSGSRSESDGHPLFYPDRLEAGTPNTAGIAGLSAGIDYITRRGMEQIRQKGLSLAQRLINGLKDIEMLKLHGPQMNENRLPVVSITSVNLSPDKLARILDQEYGIMTRPGLHCAPLAHKTTGTFPQGTVRFSIGDFNAEKEIDYTLSALEKILYP